MMEVRPSRIALQGEVLNRRTLLRLRRVVVSSCGKGTGKVSGETGKTTNRNHCRRVESVGTGSKPGSSCCPGTSLADTCLLARRSPADRWREPGLGASAERGRSSPRHSRTWLSARGQGVPQAAETVRGRVPSRGRKSDHPILVMKPGNAGGAKGMGCPDSLLDQPDVGRS